MRGRVFKVRRLRRRKRRYVFKKKRINFRKWKRVAFICLVFWGIFSLLAFMYRNVYSVVMDYAATQTINIATLVIKEGIARSDLSTYDVEDLVAFTDNSIINTPLLNHLLVSTTQQVEEVLLLVEAGDLSALGLEHLEAGPFRDGVLFEAPWSAAFNLTLFHDIGPRFPVRARMVGNAVSDIETHIIPYGINNALLEIVLNIQINMHVILPFQSEEVTVSVTSPLVIKMIEGEVPHFFFSGMNER